MRVTVYRKFEFDAGHRLMGHESRCVYLHGHRYRVTVQVEPEVGLDTIGRVIDFSVIKDTLGAWLDHNWDHQMILNSADTDAIEAVSRFCRYGSPYLLPYNPTAEYLAKYLIEEICPALFKNVPVQVVKITVDETPNCSAEVVV